MATATRSKKIPGWAWLLGVIFIFVVWVIGVNNSLISSEGKVQYTWAQVEVESQRRFDAVAQILPTVEATADFEKSTLVEVTEARTNWLDTAADPNASISDEVAATSAYESAIARLLVTVEAYPTLTATESFKTFQAQLEGNENRIAVARMDYNEAATAFNIKIRRFPTNILAGILGFEGFSLFESNEGAQEAPVIDFRSDEE